MRKSRREREQEAAEAKKREEDANAAQAYAEFLDAFEGEEVSRRRPGSGFVRADSNTAYAPSMPSSERRPTPRVSPSINVEFRVIEDRLVSVSFCVFWS